MQQRHRCRNSRLKDSIRYRLPVGFSGLRPDLGSYLRDLRLASAEYGNMTQREFAKVLEVSRETLNRIENGAQWPSYDTIVRYLALLYIEFEDVAYKSTRSEGFLPQYPDVCYELGKALDEGRILEGLTLRKLQEHSGISYSQLSRLTRGHFKGGRHVKVVAGNDTEKFSSDIRIWFTHPMLAYLSEVGGFMPDLGRRGNIKGLRREAMHVY